MTLDQLPKNSPRNIKKLTDDDLTAKLLEMGLCPGKKVEVLFKAPFGDPIAIDVDGYTLSLRKFEASLIEIE